MFSLIVNSSYCLTRDCSRLHIFSNVTSSKHDSSVWFRDSLRGKNGIKLMKITRFYYLFFTIRMHNFHQAIHVQLNLLLLINLPLRCNFLDPSCFNVFNSWNTKYCKLKPQCYKMSGNPIKGKNHEEICRVKLLEKASA